MALLPKFEKWGENLIKLQEEFKENLKQLVKDDDKIKSSVMRTYSNSRQQIFDVADNMIRGMIKNSEDFIIFPDAKEPDLPAKEIWDFHLGDTVIIKFSRQDFKWMQKKTIGWSHRMNHVYGSTGIITKVYNKLSSNVRVYFPEQYAVHTLYAGVLKKVDPLEYRDLNPRWKVGDYVKTLSSKNTLKLLQQGLDQLPEKLIGIKCRVVAVTHPCVLVTFDEKKTYDLRSASLVESEDKSPITQEEIKQTHRFIVGERVKIISNVKKLIENQKGHGGWDKAMCEIIGKIATIVHIHEDGTVLLRIEYCRNWRLNPNSVLHLGEDEIKEKDLKFLPHDIVTVTVPRNARKILAAMKVPIAFLEYLQAVVNLSLVDDDFDYYVEFNAGQHIEFDAELFCKATTAEKQKYCRIEKKVKELKVGDKVHLDIGPPNYVQAMIQELKLNPTVAKAMVESATLVGFVNPYKAVIEYENGTRFCVKKKYLTVPEKFHADESDAGVSPIVINGINNAIEQSVKDIHSKENAPMENWKVNIVNASQGIQPCVEYEIESPYATFKTVFEWLNQNSGWNMELLGERHFLLYNVEASIQELKVALHLTHGATVHKENVSTKQEVEPKTETRSLQGLELLDPISIRTIVQSTMAEIESQENVNKAQTADKKIQTDQSQRPLMTKKVIGPKGGTIKLCSYKVFYPPNSLTEEKEIELSIDNNPSNFPKEGLPITSILNIKPSMKLKIPAIVTMPTSCRAASGEAKIQIWNKEKGQDWERSQTVSLTDKNEITFKTDHFCGRVGTSVDGEEGNLEFIIKNRLFIQKDTGMILSVFWQNDESMEKILKECDKDNYKRVIPGYDVLKGRLNSEFQFSVECTSPNNIQYAPSKDNQDGQTIFKITKEFIRLRIPQRFTFFHTNIPVENSVKFLLIKYSITTQEPETFLVQWPIMINSQDAAGKEQSIKNVFKVDNSKNQAENIAQSGAHIEQTAYNTKKDMTIQEN